MVTARWYVHHCKKGIVIWISVDSHLEYKTHYSIPLFYHPSFRFTHLCLYHNYNIYPLKNTASEIPDNLLVMQMMKYQAWRKKWLLLTVTGHPPETHIARKWLVEMTIPSYYCVKSSTALAVMLLCRCMYSSSQRPWEYAGRHEQMA